MQRYGCAKTGYTRSRLANSNTLMLEEAAVVVALLPIAAIHATMATAAQWQTDAKATFARAFCRLASQAPPSLAVNVVNNQQSAALIVQQLRAAFFLVPTLCLGNEENSAEEATVTSVS